MATIFKNFMIIYKEYYENYADPRVADLPFMSSPLWIIAIIALYLYTVKRWGPKLMKNRKPFELRTFMIFYNILQIVINVYLLKEGIQIVFVKLKYSLVCQVIDYSDNPDAVRLTKLAWCYLMVKVLDLFDTVVMILRKKDRQVSFLHIYHHAGMVAVSWVGIKYIAGGHAALIPMINCFVHAIMYTYYLITVIYPESKKSIWWKRHLTELQMAQFVYLTFHCALSTFNPYCKFNKPLLFIFMIQDGFMFAMFLDFYLKTYIKKNKDEKGKEVKDN